MDRLYKGVWEKVTEDGEFSKALFKFTCAYKTRRLVDGYHTPLLDKYVFFVYNKISFCHDIAEILLMLALNTNFTCWKIIQKII